MRSETTKRIEQRRRNYRIAGVVVVPALVSLAIALIWKFVLYDQGIYFTKEAETPLLQVIVPLVGFIYVIFASIAVNSAFERYKTINRSIVRKDLHAYLEYRDQRLPALMHLLVAIPSLILLLVALTYQYSDTAAGAASVFAVSLVVLITLAITNELDNNHRRKHFRRQIPHHWLAIEPHDVFREQTDR